MIIVTGGAGFIGSNLVAALEEKGVGDLVVCDFLDHPDKEKNIAKRDLKDVVHPDALMEYLDQHKGAVDVIFHMGAISATTERDVDLIIDTNFILSRDLSRWCAQHDVRLIYASSAATYGDGSLGFTDHEDLESLLSLQPLNLYGISKNMFDIRLAYAKEQEKEALPKQWAGLKFFNVYGPNEYHKGSMMSVICKLYPEIAAGKGAKLFKSHHPDYEHGGQLRDFIYVQDCVNVMLWLYDTPDVSGLFNVGTGEARSFKDLAEATFAACGREPDIEYIDMPEILRDKYQYFTQADMNKLRAAGYDITFTSLEDGVQQYVQQFMAQDDKYR